MYNSCLNRKNTLLWCDLQSKYYGWENRSVCVCVCHNNTENSQTYSHTQRRSVYHCQSIMFSTTLLYTRVKNNIDI